MKMKIFFIFLIPLFTLLSSLQNVNAEANAQDQTEFGKLPLSFVPDVRQDAAETQFQVSTANGSLLFKPTQVTLALPGGQNPLTIIQLRFDGASESTEIVGAELLPGKVNFLTGNDPTAWLTDVPTYEGVIYRNLYPGIDLEFNGVDGLLKGTYTVNPGADPTQIRWRYEEAESLSVDTVTGDLNVMLPNGNELTERAPIAWQPIKGHDVPINVQYQLEQDKSIHFSIEDYNSAYPLILDPTLVYCSFIGSSNANSGTGIAVDSSGNIYLSGYVATTPSGYYFPIVNPFQAKNGAAAYNDYDAFVTKLNPEGNRVLFSTYIGGLYSDKALDMAIDSAGNVYLTGVTQSMNFPTQNALYSVPIDDVCLSKICSDQAFALKLSAEGNSLIYSTFLGGSATDEGDAIAVDDEGNAYVAGKTYSADFPTVNALKATRGGSVDVFLLKINTNGTAVDFSTYIGGSGFEALPDIELDNGGNIYLIGQTGSSDFPVTAANAFQLAIGGENDAFIMKLNRSASSAMYASYLGGAGNDVGQAIAVDSGGNIYLTGVANDGFPTTPGAYDRTVGAIGPDAFIAKINPNVSGSASLVYSSFLGGAREEAPLDVVAFEDGTAYVVGRTESINFPLVNAIQSNPNNTSTDYDGFISRMNPSGSNLIFSTLLNGQTVGGDFFDSITAVAGDARGNIYVTGTSKSTDFPITPNAYQPHNADNMGAGVFLVKIAPYTLDIEQWVNDSTVSEGSTVTFTLSLTNRGPNSANNIVVEDSLPAGLSFVSASGAGNYNSSDGTWSLNSLFSGQTASLNLQTTVDANTSGMTITNTAQVSQFTPADLYSANDSASVSISVGKVDLGVTLTADNTAPSPGGAVTYSVNAVNRSRLVGATGVVVTDLLPPEVSFVSASSSQGNYEPGNGEWVIGTLEAEESVTLNIVTTVNSVAPGTTFTNTVSIRGDQPDPVDSNNNSSLAILVPSCPPLDRILRVSNAYDGSPEVFGAAAGAVSGDGRYVAFQTSADNMVASDYNYLTDVFLYDRLTCRKSLISASANGYHANAVSWGPAISGDGRYVAFASNATTLINGDTNRTRDVFVRDTVLGEVTRISIASDGTQANGISDNASISRDGRFIAFTSRASNLVSGDTNNVEDVFVHDRLTGQTMRVSVSSDGVQANNVSYPPSISADGHFVTFSSTASNLIANDTNDAPDVFLHDLVTHTTTLIAASGLPGYAAPSISSDGHYIAYLPYYAKGYTGREIYLYDMRTGDATRVSTNANGVPASGVSQDPQISADGRYILFRSDAWNLVDEDTYGAYQVYLKDRITGQIVILSTDTAGIPGRDTSWEPSLSSDGHYAVFSSAVATLVINDPNQQQDVFLAENPLPVVPPVKTDLVINQTASKSVVQELDEVTYTVIVNNQGTQNATGVVIRDVIPVHSALVQVTPSQYACTQKLGQYFCTIGDLAAGSSVILNVTVRFNSPAVGSQSNIVTVWLNELDFDSWTNSSSLSLTLNSAPTALSANTAQYNEVDLAWTDNAFHETEFSIERSSDGVTNWAEIGTVAQNGQDYADTSVICESTYYYRVRAHLSDGRYTRYSNVVEVITTTCPSLPTPINLMATTVSFHQINLSWLENALDETGFSIERSLDGATDWVEIGITDPNAVEYQDTTGICETSYYFRIRAYRSSNGAYSPYSETVSATTDACPPLNPPSDVSASAISASEIRLNWTDTSLGEMGFSVERSVDGINNWIEIGQTNADINSYTDSNLTCEKSYYYRVLTHRKARGEMSDYSPTVNATTSDCLPVAAPTGLTLNPISVNQIALRWIDTSLDETDFYIERSGDGQTGWLVVGQTSTDYTLYVDNQLSCATTYYYRVRAYRSQDQEYSGYTNAVVASTLACSPESAAPSRNSVSSKTVTLFWGPITWAQVYEVQINNSKGFDGTYNYIQQLLPDQTSWTTPELNNGTYYWRVRAQKTLTQWGAWSTVESFVIAAP
ncbi:MAG: DUF11 domain-containing protein [Chloroflexi bacterium]|nr:DUF11 domain-containing protein [Chloroflexota bacterium]